MENQTVDEWCSYCGQEGEYNLKDGMVQTCKHCGHKIILCAACKSSDGTGNCNNCQYEN